MSRVPGTLQGPGHDRVVVCARKPRSALVDRDPRVVVVDERLVSLAVVDGEIPDRGRSFERRDGLESQGAIRELREIPPLDRVAPRCRAHRRLDSLRRLDYVVGT